AQGLRVLRIRRYRFDNRMDRTGGRQMDDREREAYPGPSDRAWTQATATSTPGNATTTGRSGAVGKAVETAGGLAMDAVEKTREKVAEYRDKGFEQVSRDVTEYTRSQP